MYKKIVAGTYSIPTFVSEQAADLISRILVIDPSRRITLPEIMRHEWYLNACQDQLPAVQEMDPTDKIDFRVIYTMASTLPD